MSKFIQIHFFHPSIFPLPTKQKGEIIKSFLSFIFFHPPTIFYSLTFPLLQPNDLKSKNPMNVLTEKGEQPGKMSSHS